MSFTPVSVTGLELPNAWRTGQQTDPNFDISADQLNLTSNRELWISSGILDWGTVRHSNASDPVDAQDLSTKNYVDNNGGTLWSTFPAIQAVDMDSFQINNLAEPTLDQDAATKAYVDSNAPATALDDLTDVTIISPTNLQILQFNSGAGQWENETLVVPAGNAISAGDSAVTVTDTGFGTVETTIDGIVVSTINATLFALDLNLDLNLKRITTLGEPSASTDGATKNYVDTEISNLIIPTSLDGLSDVTISSVAVNQILVNNGSGQFINQLLTKTQLPSEIAYEDEMNTYTMNNVFTEGLQVAPNKNLDMSGGQIIDSKFVEFEEQSITPTDPDVNHTLMYMADGSDFNSPDPLLQVLIDRGGTIEAKPVVTSESVFALRLFSNGMFTDETGVELITDGGIGIRLQQFKESDRALSYEVVLEGQLHTIQSPDTSPGVSNTIDLTVGSDTTPVLHFIWTALVGSVPTMQSSTVGFPTSGEFAVIGKVLLQSQANILANGPYGDFFPDYEIFDDTDRGHLSHINDRLSELDAAYISGIDITIIPTVGGGTAAEVTFSSTAGRAFELHQETIEAYDITDVAPIALANVVNEGTQAITQFTPVTNIGTDLVGLTCANGTTVISNNDNINVVLFSIHIDAEPNQTNYGINLPFDVYNGGGADADSIADTSGFAIKNIPLQARGTALLIAEVVIKITNAGADFEVIAIKDLRGQIPGAASSGGASGGGGATNLNELTDVTLNSPALNQILQNDGAGQWLNVDNPAGLLAGNNIWTGYQDLTAIADPGASLAGVIRLFTETIDANNDGLFCYLNQDGIIQKVRVV
jgi:hypothetical protein